MDDNEISQSFLSVEDLRKISKSANSVLVITASILGSMLSQEVIKAVSKSGEPGMSVFVFSCDDYIAKAFPIK